MKFNFRKIASTLASTAMLGSTVALAAATSFPAPFVEDGAADVAIVYGHQLDLGAVTDISTALSSELSSGGGSAEPLSSKAYPLFTSSQPVQLNASLNSVRATLTESNLPEVLGDASFSGNVEAETSFQITFGANPRLTFAKQPTSSDDPQVGISYGTVYTNYLYNATATFNKAVNLTHVDSQGETIELFGNEFIVSSATDHDTLVLFRSAQTLQLSVGAATSTPSQTVEVAGETYTVELIAASDTSATIKVTDSSGKNDQKEINEAASKKILGVEVAVNTADESTATNTIQAEVLVGADRLTMEEGSEVKVGTDQDPIDGTNVDFGGTPPALTSLTLQVFAASGSQDAILPGDALTDPVFGSFRVVFDGLSVGLDSEEDREEILIQPSGSDKMGITFTSWEGEELSSWDFINNETGGNPSSFLGDSEEQRLIVQEMGQINESAYAVLGNEEDGVLVKLMTLTNSSSSSYSDDDVIFKNLISDQTYETQITAEGTGTVTIEGTQFTVTYLDDRSGNGAAYVRLNSLADSSSNQMILYPTIQTSKGAKLAFYEPLTINLDSWDGAGNDASAFMLPDGDGYTTVSLTSHTNGGARFWNVTFGSTTTSVNTTAGGSAYGSVGALSYNVTFAASGGSNTTVVYLRDPSGGNIDRPGVVIFEEKDESNNYEAVIVQTSGAGTSDNGISPSDTDFTWNADVDMSGTAYGTSGYQTEKDDDLYQMLDQWGTLVTTDQSDSDQYKVTISYPDEQEVAKVYVDSIVEGSGSTALGDVKIMDDELASSGMSGKNLIVVGGSCVNTAATSLLGSSAGCGASWTAATGTGSGEWIIQTFANPWASSKVATLVAGWEQGDTANAATYLRTKNPTTDVGAKWKGTTATAATPVTSPSA